MKSPLSLLRSLFRKENIQMNYENLSNVRLFEVWLRMHYFGLGSSGVGSSAQIEEIESIMLDRDLLNTGSMSAYAKGLEYVQRSNYRQASLYFREATQISSGFLEAYSNLGGCFIELRELEEALTVLDEGKSPGLTINLAKNRGKTLKLLERGKESYTEEIRYIFKETDECVKLGSRLRTQAQRFSPLEEKKLAGEAIIRCIEIGYLVGMSEDEMLRLAGFRIGIEGPISIDYGNPTTAPLLNMAEAVIAIVEIRLMELGLLG